MPQPPKVTLYKHVKIDGKWRYCRAALSTNNKLKPHAVWIGEKEIVVPEGSYCLRNGNQWIDVGNDPAEALRQRTKMPRRRSLSPSPSPSLLLIRQASTTPSRSI